MRGLTIGALRQGGTTLAHIRSRVMIAAVQQLVPLRFG
jgi:hypothetical protein